MPLFLGPVLAPLLTGGVATALRVAGFAYVVNIAREAIEYVLDTEGFRGAISRLINEAISDAGVPGLAFSNVFDPLAVKAEAVEFATGFVGNKIGADFSGIDWATVEKDEILLRLSRVVRDRINSETQSQLADLWPVEVAKQSIEDEIIRQVTAGFGDESEG